MELKELVSDNLATQVQVQPATSIANSQWDDFVHNSDRSSIYHLSNWRGIIEEVFGHKAVYLCARGDGNEVLGILPMVRIESRIFGRFVVSMPYFNYGGAVGVCPAIETSLMENARQLAEQCGASHLEFRDRVAREGDRPVRLDKVAMRLALPETSEILWKSFRSKLRAQINRPLRENMDVEIGRHRLLDQFYQVFARNMRDLGTPVYAKRWFERILDVFSDNAFIVVVQHNGQAVAGAFLLGFRETMEIPWASSIREFNSLGVNMLLYWESMKLAIDRQYEVFDFGRSTVGSGTFRFKKQWGAKPQQLHWHYWVQSGGEPPKLNPQNPSFSLPIKVWQKLPLGVANWLGPKISKSLP